MDERGTKPDFLFPNEACARCLAASVRGGGGGGPRGSRAAGLEFAWDWFLRIFSNALAAFFLASGSLAVCCFAVGGTPDENRVCHLCAPAPEGGLPGFCGFLLGGVGNCWPTLDQGLPLTPDAPEYRFRPKVASNLAFC